MDTPAENDQTINKTYLYSREKIYDGALHKCNKKGGMELTEPYWIETLSALYLGAIIRLELLIKQRLRGYRIG